MHAQSCPALCHPCTVAHLASLSVEFSTQEYWGGLPFPPPGGLPDPGIEPVSPELAGGFFTTEPPRKPPRLRYFPTIPKMCFTFFSHLLPWPTFSLLYRTGAGRGWGQEEKGTTEDEVAG